MKQLHVGTHRKLPFPKGSFLYLCDDLPEHRPKSKVFDPNNGDAFDPLKGMTKRNARDLARALYSSAPEGGSTLTVRNGRRALAHALANGKRLDALEIKSDIKGVKEEVEGMVDELLFTEVARSCLCSEREYSFTGSNTKIFARLNRAELGDDDALLFGLFLIARYKKQIIVEDAGFYLRDMHTYLLRENRLILGVNNLSELPPKLRRDALLIEDKEGSGCTFEDAETLALYEGLRPDRDRVDNPYNNFITDVMALTDTA